MVPAPGALGRALVPLGRTLQEERGRQATEHGGMLRHERGGHVRAAGQTHRDYRDRRVDGRTDDRWRWTSARSLQPATTAVILIRVSRCFFAVSCSGRDARALHARPRAPPPRTRGKDPPIAPTRPRRAHPETRPSLDSPVARPPPSLSLRTDHFRYGCKNNNCCCCSLFQKRLSKNAPRRRVPRYYCTSI